MNKQLLTTFLEDVLDQLPLVDVDDEFDDFVNSIAFLKGTDQGAKFLSLILGCDYSEWLEEAGQELEEED